MNSKFILVFILTLSGLVAHAQTQINGRIITPTVYYTEGSGAPSGNCSSSFNYGAIYFDHTNFIPYFCANGGWTAGGSASGGFPVPSAWSSMVTYSAGAIAYDGSGNNYSSLASGNTGNALTNGTYWHYLGGVSATVTGGNCVTTGQVVTGLSTAGVPTCAAVSYLNGAAIPTNAASLATNSSGQLIAGSTPTPVTITASSTPAINAAAGSMQTITLSANAVPTISGIAAGQNITFQICQPSSGGPYSWTWPAVVLSGMTVGTTAGGCSIQTFYSFNGTNLVPNGTGIINVSAPAPAIAYGTECDAFNTPSGSTESCTLTVGSSGSQTLLIFGSSITGVFSSAATTCGTANTIRTQTWGSGQTAFALAVYNATPGSCTVTVTYTTTPSNPTLQVLDFSNANLATPVDNASCTSTPFCSGTGTGTPLTSGSITTANANEMVVAFGEIFNNGDTLAAGSGYTLIPATVSHFYGSEYALQASTGAYTPSMTAGADGSSSWVALAVALNK